MKLKNLKERINKIPKKDLTNLGLFFDVYGAIFIFMSIKINYGMLWGDEYYGVMTDPLYGKIGIIFLLIGFLFLIFANNKSK